MTHSKNIQKAPNGYFYLRLQRNGTDRRISLKTRNLAEAELSAAIFRATISRMTIDPNKIKTWTLETDGQNIKISTEDNDADRASAIEAVKAYVVGRRSNYSDLDTPKPTAPTVTIKIALAEYLPFLHKSDTAFKTQRMAESVLADLVKKLGATFDMSKINDEVIETKWLEKRLKDVAKTTAKRDLTFIRGFVTWAADRKRKYTPAALTLTVEAKGENWSYLSAADLKLIFDNLPLLARQPWQLFIPIIALYTGARIAEIATLQTADFIEKNGIQAMRLRGTKTDASDRTIPIHAHLIELGLLELVTARLKKGKINIFDIAHHNQNGAGATASKWYTKYKNAIGMKDKLKVFHSFRPTIVDHLKQAGSGFEARCQYLGHDSGGGVHNKVYGRNELNLTIIRSEVVDKIDWQKYCGWQPDLALLKDKAKSL